MELASIEELIERYGTDIYRFCNRLTGLKTDAEDLYQQTFLRILEMDVSIDWSSNPKSFLFSVTNGIWKNEIKKRSRRDFITPCTFMEEEIENVIADTKDTQKEVLSKIECEALQRMISALEKKFYVSVILYYSFELSLEEIAAIEKIPVGTVKSRLHKARKILKKGLEAEGYVR